MSGKSKTSIIKNCLASESDNHSFVFVFSVEQSLLQPKIRFTDLRSNSVELVVFFNGCQQKPGNKKRLKRLLQSIY